MKRLTASLALLLLALTACGSSIGANATPQGDPSSVPLSTAAAPAVKSSYTKVMIIAEENETDSAVIGSTHAPYLTKLAKTYGNATNMHAGYPKACPSLAAYILITSGSRHGICDDKPPADHHISGDNIFKQVAAAGLQWRQYAESMTSNCRRTNGKPGKYLVRHAPPPYYTSEASRCQSWDVPLGRISHGQLHDALIDGLPAYSFVTANACHDMHGASTCRTSLVKRGDNWLKSWLPKIIASPDFQAARLVVIVTWDEGSSHSNHIPTLVISRTTHKVKSAHEFTHCSTLRTSELVLGLPLLGCAATATSFRKPFTF
jgi:phosphatidylinositol-3-phosphatase